MNVAAIAAVASAALAAFTALLTRRISAAPGSSDLRPFWMISLSAALYSIATLAAVSGAPPAVAVLASRVQVASAMVQLWGWLRFSHAFLDLRPRRAERIGALGLPAAALAALVPGLVVGDRIVERNHPAVGAVYRATAPAPLGVAILVLAAIAAACLLARFARAWRRGVPSAGIIAAALCPLLVAGVNDALVFAGAIDTPRLLDAGFVAPVLGLAWVIAGRFVESARALQRLRGQLLLEVEVRTKDLATALDALHQAEKLAAVGQFASGVAHEVNSPASVVMANLRYLRESSRGGGLPADASEVVADALDAMTRINDLVRKLVDAGRIAASPGSPGSVPVAEVVARAVADARAALPASISLEVRVPERLSVRARRGSLEEVLASLLANAAQAIPAGRAGRITVTAERSGAGVRIGIADDGSGMTAEVLRRAFDPFFTTRPAGQGAGLGLAVARGLVEAQGGALWLESTPGSGTRALVELPEGTPTPVPDPARGP
ncbi:MAG TPA: ATP-binding protein [Anaeromyxobacter sp.]